MSNNTIFINKIHKNNPLCVGMGLVALDVILNGNPQTLPKMFAGGSCGNILSILSFLGWKSYPVARLNNNRAADELISDLKKWDVKTDLVFKREDGSTPIIIHRILKDKLGNPKHRFEFKIPGTRQWLPNFKALVNNDTELIKTIVPKSKVFYFDRVSRSAIELAKYYKGNGALVVFEPSSYGEERLFKEGLSVSHILKFSNERLANYTERYPVNQCLLEIETLGSKGLQYRTKKSKNKAWKLIKAPVIDVIKDAAGAGDWCTAGIVHHLGINGFKSLSDASIPDIENALKTGQLLGALNCKFDGARGMMYNIAFRNLAGYLEDISMKKQPDIKYSPQLITQLTDFSFENLINVL